MMTQNPAPHPLRDLNLAAICAMLGHRKNGVPESFLPLVMRDGTRIARAGTLTPTHGIVQRYPGKIYTPLPCADGRTAATDLKDGSVVVFDHQDRPASRIRWNGFRARSLFPGPDRTCFATDFKNGRLGVADQDLNLGETVDLRTLLPDAAEVHPLHGCATSQGVFLLASDQARSTAALLRLAKDPDWRVAERAACPELAQAVGMAAHGDDPCFLAARPLAMLGRRPDADRTEILDVVGFDEPGRGMALAHRTLFLLTMRHVLVWRSSGEPIQAHALAGPDEPFLSVGMAVEARGDSFHIRCTEKLSNSLVRYVLPA